LKELRLVKSKTMENASRPCEIVQRFLGGLDLRGKGPNAGTPGEALKHPLRIDFHEGEVMRWRHKGVKIRESQFDALKTRNEERIWPEGGPGRERINVHQLTVKIIFLLQYTFSYCPEIGGNTVKLKNTIQHRRLPGNM